MACIFDDKVRAVWEALSRFFSAMRRRIGVERSADKQGGDLRFHRLSEIIAQVFRTPNRPEVSVQEVHEIAEQRRASFAANLFTAVGGRPRSAVDQKPIGGGNASP